MRDGGVDEVPAVLGGQSPLIPCPMKLDPEDGKNFAHQRAPGADWEEYHRSISFAAPSAPARGLPPGRSPRREALPLSWQLPAPKGWRRHPLDDFFLLKGAYGLFSHPAHYPVPSESPVRADSEAG